MRYFKLATHLTVPRMIKPGPGNTHHRPKPGDVIAIGDKACSEWSHFINSRLRAGDFVEVTEAEYLAFCKAEIEAENLAAAKAQEASAQADSTSAPAAKPAKGK